MLFDVGALNNEVSRLKRTIKGEIQFRDIIGQSKALTDTIIIAERAAISDIPVLIKGESGTGKELFADAIHGSSKRAGEIFCSG